MRVVYFKVCMLVDFKKEINIERELKKIVDTAESFSIHSKGKFIDICDVDDKRIVFIIRIVADKGFDSFTLRAVSLFLKQVSEISKVEYNNKKKYFKIEESVSLFEEDYYMLHRDAFLNINEKIENSEEQKNSLTEDIDLENAEKLPALNNITEFKLPKRTFPSLQKGSPTIFKSPQSLIEYNSLNETLNELDSLIGIDDAKKQIKNITSFIVRNNERYVNLNIENPGLYYNTAIVGNKGTGKTTIAKIICHIYYHLGVIGKGKIINLDCNSIWAGQRLDSLIGDAQSGVIVLDNAHTVSFDKRGKADIISTFNDWFSTYKNNFVFLLVGEADGIGNLLKDEILNKKINFKINMPDFNSDESIAFIKKFASDEHFIIDKEVFPELTCYINYLKDKKIYENAYTAKSIFEKAIIKNGAHSNILTIDDFAFEKPKVEGKEAKEDIYDNPLNELENMIGLDTVKEKVKEIAAFAKTQLMRRELGLSTSPICLHTCFTGNPGTGKTTVARLLGKIFKEIGVLDTDKFTEASRQDFVGAYVGHTALKTASKVNEAMGGVLFIDEAYSMKSESKIDFGHEAVATLIKMMEDMRDNIVIIFAGYTDEMEQYLEMNPGLRDRVQFKLNFDDYSSDELLKIWLKFFKDELYLIEDEALTEMTIITNKLSNNRRRNFSNGRIIRKCFERAKIYQSVRIINEKLITADEIIKIKASDIKLLYYDKDLNEELNKVYLSKCIGFRM